jgi:hypothetical protein
MEVKMAILGKKIGMTQIFEDGKVVPVTVIEAGPNFVLQTKTTEKDGYVAIQVGFGEKREKNTTKPLMGIFNKAGVKPQRFVRELRVESVEGYKDLREYFQFGKEENRIFEALIARITLSFLAYNLTSYINRVQNEPQTLGNLFRDLECQLEALAISMELFLKILEELIKSQEIVKRNKDLEQIIHMLRVYTKKQLGFMCES